MWAPGSPGQQVNSQRVRVHFSLHVGRDSELTFMLIFMLGGIYSHPQTPSQLSFAGCFPLSLCVVVSFIFWFWADLFPFFITLQCQDIFWLPEFMQRRCYSNRSCLCFSPSFIVFFLRLDTVTRKRFAEAPHWLRCGVGHFSECGWGFLWTQRLQKVLQTHQLCSLSWKCWLEEKCEKREKNSSPWSITGAGVAITFSAKLACFK